LALKSTIFKVELQIADMDRGYYDTHALTLARHPSETSERMMIRVLAFALCADERLEFGAGISTADQPDLWRRSLTGEIEQWIEIGQPDPRRIHKSCGRADSVRVYLYGGNKAATWWEQERSGLERHTNLAVTLLLAEQTAQLAELADRSISLQCNIQDGEVWMMREARSVHVTPRVLFGG
jgi:uncharacterized protein YaeQ